MNLFLGFTSKGTTDLVPFPVSFLLTYLECVYTYTFMTIVFSNNAPIQININNPPTAVINEFLITTVIFCSISSVVSLGWNTMTIIIKSEAVNKMWQGRWYFFFLKCGKDYCKKLNSMH